jgi:RNA polymerase primary sigma factor
MDKELQFSKTLQKVKDLAKLSGNTISKEEVDEAFRELEFGEEQMKLVYEYLEKANIGIDKEVDTDALLTTEDQGYLQFYLEELQELPTVSEGEKEATILSAMAGDDGAQAKLIQILLPQVIDMAKLYAGQGVFLEDLIGEGNVALTIGVTMLGCFENANSFYHFPCR